MSTRWMALMAQRYGVGIVATATLIIMILLYALAPEAQRQPQAENVMALSVVPVNLSRQPVHLTAYGQAEPAERIPLLAQVTGTVRKLDPQFVSGGRVAAEANLVVLADEDYQLALAKRENDVSAALLHLEEVRAKALVAHKVSGNKSNDYALLKPHLREAETRVAAARAALASAELELARTRINAPFAGRLRDVRVRVGQVVAAGELLAELYTPDVLEVRLPLRDEWLKLLELPLQQGVFETPLPITFKARFGGQMNRWKGTLVRSEGGLDANQMMVLVARVEAIRDGVMLEPGVWLEAMIQGREIGALARLPRSVVGHDGAVWRVGVNRLLERQPVEVAYMDDEFAYISSGLNQGDEIALSGDLRLLEGMRVEPVKPWLKTTALRMQRP